MPHPGIIYPSPTKDGWKEWSWHNLQAHLAIDAALLRVRGITVQAFRLWPVGEHDLKDFLEQHQFSHQSYNQALGLAGQDLSDLDTKDKTKRDAWFWNHQSQHQAIAEVLGLSTL